MIHFDNYKNLNEYGGDLGGWLVGGELILFFECGNNNDNNYMVDYLKDIESLGPPKVCNYIRQKVSDMLVIVPLNINSLKNEFTSLSTMIKDNYGN